jgi:hypothetical protein
MNHNFEGLIIFHEHWTKEVFSNFTWSLSLKNRCWLQIIHVCCWFKYQIHLYIYMGNSIRVPRQWQWRGIFVKKHGIAHILFFKYKYVFWVQNLKLGKNLYFGLKIGILYKFIGKNPYFGTRILILNPINLYFARTRLAPLSGYTTFQNNYNNGRTII